MAHELLTPEEMAEADRLTIERGPFDGIGLMRRAGAAVASVVLARFGQAPHIHVLCGPGNNGGDGYVVARILHETGVELSLWAEAPPRPGSDAATAAAECPVSPLPLSDYAPARGAVVVDALYGAGLCRPLGGHGARAVERTTELGLDVVAVDLPSGVSGGSGQVLGVAFNARVTVTFARKKPGHLLLPGRQKCGEVIVADIGISDDVIASVRPRCFENGPALWQAEFPRPAFDTYKYKRGHVGVFSGGAASTGAARLSAMAAARAGAGAVTVLSPPDALPINAAHLTAIMVRKFETLEDVAEFVDTRKARAFVFGPGLGAPAEMAAPLISMLGERGGSESAVVFDADGLTALARSPQAFFEAAAREGAPALVLTPHEGEFARLFPDLAVDQNLSKLEKVRRAAARSSSVVLLKGPDTVIAAPDGRAAVNANGTPYLATAGSGDVLAGVAAALLAQGMPAFEAACAAVWMHGEAGNRFGPGLTADDLPDALLPVLSELLPAESG